MTAKDTTTRIEYAGAVQAVARSVAIGLATLLVVSFVVFFATQALPGDVARQILGANATAEQLANLREQLGLDRPAIVQYLDWLGGIARLDFGTSLAARIPVGELLATRAANTVAVVLIAALVAIPLAFVLGILAARRPGGLADHVISAGAQLSLSMPEFVIGIALLSVLAANVLHLVPPASILDPRYGPLAQPQLLVLPVLTMVLIAMPHLVESVKTLMREELGSEHVRWARLSGIRESRIRSRYALPNVLAPSLQVSATTLGYLLGGTVAVETVFSFPGIGSALVSAVASRDVVVVQAITMSVTAILVLAFVVADVIGMLTTPRLRAVNR
ncbi:MAG: ABC transporter permease [Protaetiibacter sp.]